MMKYDKHNVIRVPHHVMDVNNIDI